MRKILPVIAIVAMSGANPFNRNKASVQIWTNLFPMTVKLLLGGLLLIFCKDIAQAALPLGNWDVNGKILDLRRSEFDGTNVVFYTNSLSLIGYTDGLKFLINIDPVQTEDEIAECAGWDGEFLRFIQRYPNTPGKGMARDQALGYVEPSVFSRYATAALTGVLLSFANDEALNRITSGGELVILGNERRFPEENNTFRVRRIEPNKVEIEATCPGVEISPSGLIKIPGLDGGFVRWTHKVSFVTNETGVSVNIDYKRYGVIQGRPVLDRIVVADLNMRLGSESLKDFRPLIGENSLRVRDYSGRPSLFPYSKGIMDQNCVYSLTNHAWDNDLKLVALSFAKRKDALATYGAPAALIDNPYRTSSTAQSHKRVLIVGIMIIASVLFGATIWLLSRQINNKKQKQPKQKIKMKSLKKMARNMAITCFAAALLVPLVALAGEGSYNWTTYCTDTQCACLVVNGVQKGSCQTRSGTGIGCSSGGSDTCYYTACDPSGPWTTVACP